MIRHCVMVATMFCMSLFSMEQDIEVVTRKETKDSKTVSVLYYPSGKDCDIAGHTRLEVNGISYYIDMGYFLDGKKIDRAIEKSRHKDGSPFFRYTISVTDGQFAALCKRRTRDWSLNPVVEANCSYNVCRELRLHGDYHVPHLLSASPLLTATYVASAHRLGSKRVTKIDFYGDRSMAKNVRKCLPGALLETAIISLPFLAIYCFYKCFMLTIGC